MKPFDLGGQRGAVYRDDEIDLPVAKIYIRKDDSRNALSRQKFIGVLQRGPLQEACSIGAPMKISIEANESLRNAEWAGW